LLVQKLEFIFHFITKLTLIAATQSKDTQDEQGSAT
jgi:hypothetical protein